MWNGGLEPHQPFHSGSSCHPGRTELPGPHDLGPDPRIVKPQERIIDAAVAAGHAHHLAPPSRGEHPLVQSFAGVPERGLEALAFAGPEPIERHGEELDAGK